MKWNRPLMGKISTLALSILSGVICISPLIWLVDLANRVAIEPKEIKEHVHNSIGVKGHEDERLRSAYEPLPISRLFVNAKPASLNTVADKDRHSYVQN